MTAIVVGIAGAGSVAFMMGSNQLGQMFEASEFNQQWTRDRETANAQRAQDRRATLNANAVATVEQIVYVRRPTPNGDRCYAVVPAMDYDAYNSPLIAMEDCEVVGSFALPAKPYIP